MALSNGSKYLTDPGSTPLVNDIGTEARTLSDRFADVVNAKDFGAAGDGVTDDTIAINNARVAANTNNKPLLIEGGDYLYSGTIYPVGGPFIWFNDEFTSAVNVLASARTSCILLTGATGDSEVTDGAETRVLLSSSVQAYGDQHADAIRANLINYSVGGAGNTAFYGNATSHSTAGWSAAVHGEIRHGGGTSQAFSSESACYSADGSFYGLVVNNSTMGAPANHPTTGEPKTAHPDATAIHVTGNQQWGDAAGWQYGLEFTQNSLRGSGTAIHQQADVAASLETSGVASAADILLQGDSTYGAIFGGAYTSGTAIRLTTGNGIGWEATNNIRTRFESSAIRTTNAGAERWALSTSASPSLSFLGTKVVGTQQAAIPDATTGTEVDTLNAILAAMRAHGLIAT